MDCNSCEARHNCMAVVEPGSIACIAHLLHEGTTKAAGNPYQTRGGAQVLPAVRQTAKSHWHRALLQQRLVRKQIYSYGVSVPWTET